MSSTSLIDHLKSAALALLIAVLLWVFAEGESLASRVVTVNIAIAQDATSDVIIRPDDPEFRGTARLRLEGSSRSIDLAAAAVGSRLRLAPGLPGVPTEPGQRRVLDLRDAISAMPELKGLGSSVAEIEPRQVLVTVIPMTSRELPVRVEFPPELALDGEPVASPAVAQVRLPKASLSAISEGAALSAVITEADLRRLRGDGPQSVTASLRLPPALVTVDPVLIIPETVSVQLRVRKRLDTVVVPSVPVWFALPPTEDAARWSVELPDKFLTDVALTGPADEIAKVRAGTYVIKALVELSSDDLQSAVTSRPVTFTGLPPGVTASTPRSDVRLIIKRAATRQP